MMVMMMISCLDDEGLLIGRNANHQKLHQVLSREYLVELLIVLVGLEVNKPYANERTLLMFSSQWGYLGTVHAFLKASADIEAKDQVSLKREPLTRPLVNLNVTCMRICGIRFIPDTVCGCH
jgi:hypothetical protein